MSETAKESSLIVTNNNVSINSGLKQIIALADINKLLDYCKPIAESGISPYKDPKSVAAVALWSLDKNISLVDALANTFVLNGRVSLNSHMIRGLLQRAGVVHKVVKDYAPVYQYKLKDRIFTEEEIQENKDQFKIFFNINAIKAWIEANPNSPITPVLRSETPIDIITIIKLKRRLPNGLISEIISKFSMAEARQAGLLEKDNWVKYPRQCLFARTYVIGAREIASDIIFGSYTPEEMGYPDLDTIGIIPSEEGENLDFVEAIDAE